MSRQPCPIVTGVRAPRQWSLPADVFERPWHKRREWANEQRSVADDDGPTDDSGLHDLAGAA